MLDLSVVFTLIALVVGKRTPTVRIDDDDRDRHRRVRCPACQWEPRHTDSWMCDPGCGHCWNTFLTRGECPGCEKLWRETACLRCGVWSRHADWYTD